MYRSTPPEPIQFIAELKELNDLKKVIDDSTDAWDDAKRIVNPYEKVFSSKGWNWKGSVAKINPVSRAFFKMIEIAEYFRVRFSKPIQSLHLAEGPGGFIQAWAWIRRFQGLTDTMYGNTLKKHPMEDPWNRLTSSTFLDPEVHFLKGKDEQGDLFQKETRDEIYETCRGRCMLITGDGGFDFSDDFIHQEMTAIPLIVAQIVSGLPCLLPGGVFVLKVFDVGTLPMIQILYFLRDCFETFQVIKPKMSRVGNSEKYILGIGLKSSFSPEHPVFKEMERYLELSQRTDLIIGSFVEDLTWESMDVKFRENYTATIGKLLMQQKYWMCKTLNIMRRGTKEEKDALMEKGTESSLEWCRFYRIPISRAYHEVHSNE
jgi:23S rRNA U2552 (ribose-2'-O)-methylase RlmE/FtsJ